MITKPHISNTIVIMRPSAIVMINKDIWILKQTTKFCYSSYLSYHGHCRKPII